MKYRSHKTAQPGQSNQEEVDDPKTSIFSLENESFAIRKDQSAIQPTVRIEDYIQEDSRDQFSDTSDNRDLQNDRVEFESYKSESNHGLNRSGHRQTQQLYSNQSFNNDPISVTSISHLFEIIGVTLTDNFFALNGQVYHLKLPLSDARAESNRRELQLNLSQDGENDALISIPPTELFTPSHQYNNEQIFPPPQTSNKKQNIQASQDKGRYDKDSDSQEGEEILSPQSEDNYLVQQAHPNQQLNQADDGNSRTKAISINVPNQLTSVSASQSVIHYEDEDKSDQPLSSLRQSKNSYKGQLNQYASDLNTTSLQQKRYSEQFGKEKASSQQLPFKYEEETKIKSNSNIQEFTDKGVIKNLEDDRDSEGSQEEATIHLREEKTSRQQNEDLYNHVSYYPKMHRPLQESQISVKLDLEHVQGEQKIKLMDEFQEDEEPDSVSSKIQTKRISTKNLEYVNSNSGRKLENERLFQLSNGGYSQNFGFASQLVQKREVGMKQQHMNVMSQYTTNQERYSNEVSPTARGRQEEGAFGENDSQFNQEMFSINLINSGEGSPEIRQEQHPNEEEEFKITKYKSPKKVYAEQSQLRQQSIEQVISIDEFRSQDEDRDLNDQQILLLEQQNFNGIGNLVSARQTLDSRRKSLSDINLLQTLNDYQDERLLEVNLLKDSALQSPFISKQAFDELSMRPSLDVTPDQSKKRNNTFQPSQGIEHSDYHMRANDKQVNEGSYPFANEVSSEAAYPSLQQQIDFLQNSIRKASERLSTEKERNTPKNQDMPFKQSSTSSAEESSLQKYMNSQLKQRRDSSKSMKNMRKRASDQLRQSHEKRKQSNRSSDSIEQSRSLNKSNQKSLNVSQTNSNNYNSAGYKSSPSQQYRKQVQRKSLGQVTQPLSKQTTNQNYGSTKHYHHISDIQRHFNQTNQSRKEETQQMRVDEMSYQINLTEQNEDNEEVLEVQIIDAKMEAEALDSRNDESEYRDPDESQPILRAVSSKALMLEDYQRQKQQLISENRMQLMRQEGLIALKDDSQEEYESSMPMKTPLYQELQDMKFDSNPQFKNLNDDFAALSPPNNGSIPMFDFDQSELVNVAFMFAQPIYSKDADQQCPSMSYPINPQSNFTLLQDSLAQTQNSLRLSYSQATVNNFYHLMTQNPEGIHLVGDVKTNDEDPDDLYFVIEKESGEAELLNPDSLSDILGQSEKELDFMFVLSTSDMQSLLKYFSSTQQKHVICVKYDQDQSDREDVLQTFVLSFYGSLYASQISVCEAYSSSLSKVIQLFGQNHEDNFQLLTQHLMYDQNECRKLGNYMKGSLELVDEPFFQPSMPQHQAINNCDMRKLTTIISQIVLNRLVVILGYSGSGKSCLLGPILSFISQRNFFASGIIYVNMRGVQEPIYFLKLLALTIMSELPYFEAEKLKDSIMMNTEQCFKLILQFLKGISQPLLFVFDNTEEAQIRFDEIAKSSKDNVHTVQKGGNDNEKRSDSALRGSQLSSHQGFDIQFQSFDRILEEIMTQNPFIKVLLTSQRNLEEGSLVNISKSAYVLQSQQPSETVKQVLQSMSRQLTQQEVDELIGFCSPQKRERSQSTMIPNLQSPLSNSIEALEKHELFEIMSVNQQAYKICKNLLNRMTLHEVYEGFKNSEATQILLDDKVQCLSLAALRLSLQMAFKEITKLDDHEQILQFFYLICLMKAPATEKQLRKIWGLDYQKHLEILVKYEIVSLSWEDPARVIVSSLVCEYGRAKASLQDMSLMMNELSKYLNSKSDKVYRGNSKYRKSKSKGLYKCKQLKWRNIWIEIQLYQIFEALKQDYTEQVFDSEENQISKIQISKVYEGQQLSRTPSQPTLKKINTLRGQASSQLVKQKTQTNKGARTSFNGVPAKQPAASTKNNSHLKKSSWLQQNFTPNLTSSQIKIPNGTPARKGQRHQMANSYASAIVSHSRNRQPNKQNSSTEKYTESYLFQDHTDFNSPVNEEASLQDYLSNLQVKYSQLDTKEQIKLILKDSQEMRIQNRKQACLPEEIKLINILRDPSILDSLIRPSDLSSQNYRSSGASQKDELQGASAFQNYQQSSTNKRQHSIKIMKQVQSPQFEDLAQSNKDENMHELEKALLKFMMNLFLFREMEQLYQFIQNVAFSFDGCKLYLANLYRIKGLLYQSQQNTQKCVEFLKKGKELYKYKDSIYGEALSRYSIALFQKKLLVQQNLDDSIFLEHGYSKLVKKFEKALQGFKEVNHLIGQALCHNQLSLIFKTRFAEQKSLNDIEQAKAEFNHHQNEQMRIMQEYQDYPVKKKCPHVKRVQGPEFSLMLELVLNLLNVNLFPVPQPIQQQKYELQAIQEDEMEESVMFSEDNNYKETLKEQQEVLASFLDHNQENEQQSTPKSRVSRLNQKEIAQIYSNQSFQQTVESYESDSQSNYNSIDRNSKLTKGELQRLSKQAESNMPVVKLNISSVAKKKQTASEMVGQPNIKFNTQLSARRQQEKIISGQKTIEVYDDSEDSSPQSSFREQSHSQDTSQNIKQKSGSRYKQQVTPDNDVLLSASKPKSAQRTNEYGYTSHYLTEEDNRIYTCSPQESSINHIHQTEEIQMNQQAYFSQTSKRSMRVHSQLEVVEEEAHHQFELLEMMTPPNQRMSLRNKTKVKTSLDMTDKSKAMLSSSGVLPTSSSQIGNLKQRHSMEAKLPKKLSTHAQPPKPNATKNKILQINIKQLK